MSLVTSVVFLLIAADQPAIRPSSPQYKSAMQIAKLESPEFEDKCYELLRKKDFASLDLVLGLVRTRFPLTKGGEAKMANFYHRFDQSKLKSTPLSLVLDEWQKSTRASGPSYLVPGAYWQYEARRVYGPTPLSALSGRQRDDLVGFLRSADFECDELDSFVKLGGLKYKDLDMGEYYTQRIYALPAKKNTDKTTILALLNKGVASDPYYLPLYTIAARYLLTMEYGKNERDWLAVLNLATRKTRAKAKDSFYARIVYQLSLDCNPHYLMQQNVDPNKLGRSFESWMLKESNTDLIWNKYVSLMLYTRDKKAILRALQKRPKNGEIITSVWMKQKKEHVEYRLNEWKEWASDANRDAKPPKAFMKDAAGTSRTFAFSHDNKFVLVGQFDGKLWLMDARTKRLKDTHDFKGKIFQICSFPNLPIVALVCQRKKMHVRTKKVFDSLEVVLFNYVEKKEIFQGPLYGGGQLCVDNQGMKLVTNVQSDAGVFFVLNYDEETKRFQGDEIHLKGKPEQIKLWKGGSVALSHDAAGQATHAVFSAHPAGYALYSFKDKTTTFMEKDQEATKDAQTVYPDVQPWMLIEGDFMASAYGPNLEFWDLKKKKMTKFDAQAHYYSIRPMLYLAKKNLLVTCSKYNSAIRFWDVSTQKSVALLKSPPWPETFHNAMALSPNKKELFHLVNTGNNSTIWEYDLDFLDQEKK